MSEWSRRETLQAVAGATLVGFAGCASFPDVLDSGPGKYDPETLRSAAAEPAPEKPVTFPVEIPDGMIERHRRVAHEWTESVPERPDVPNDAVANQIAEKRAEVIESATEADASTAMERLDRWRSLRASAAEIAGAHRAATEDVRRESVLSRSERLREELLSFQESWSYQAGSIHGAVAFHRRIENMVERCRRELRTWPPFPDRPGDDVFAVGEVMGALEHAGALVQDADRLRRRHLERGETTPYRYDLLAAVERFRHAADRAEPEGVGELVRERRDAFERSLDVETPAFRAFDRAVDTVELYGTRRDDETGPAGRFVSIGRAAAARDALVNVAGRIRDGDSDLLSPPEDATAVVERHETALDALRTAWSATPEQFSVAFAAPAYESVREAREELHGATEYPYASEVSDVVGLLTYAERHAKAVPAAVELATSTLPLRLHSRRGRSRQ